MDSMDNYILETLFGFLGSFFHFISLSLVVMMAIYINKRFKSSGSIYVSIGTFLQVFSFLFYKFIQHFLIHKIDMNNISSYFSINGFIGSIGHILFLLGMFKIFQELYQQVTKGAES